MSMLGKVERLARLIHPGSRLRRGLVLLEDCLAGHLPEVARMVSNLPPGETSRVSLEGDALYLLIQCYQPKRRAEGRFEAHARHSDLQFLWSGCECIEVCDLRTLEPAPTYDRSGNIYFPLGDTVHSRLILQAGDVAVLSPQEAHAACLRLEGETSELVRKIVVKVMDAHLAAGSAEAPFLTAGRKQEAVRLDATLASEPLKANPGGMR
jgi:biofilm protein TabA